MTLRYEKFITRQMLRDAPGTLFVFGDNMIEKGFGGQAKEMRGEPNAVGIPTKMLPSNGRGAFFSDSDYDRVVDKIKGKFHLLARHISKGGTVVWPQDGIGTGLADLQRRSKRIWDLIEFSRAAIEHIAKQKA